MTLAALREIGALDAEVLDRTIDIFPNWKVPKDRDERWGPFENMTEEQFQALPEDPGEILEMADAQFLKLGDEKLMSQLLEYWKKA